MTMIVIQEEKCGKLLYLAHRGTKPKCAQLTKPRSVLLRNILFYALFIDHQTAHFFKFTSILLLHISYSKATQLVPHFSNVINGLVHQNIPLFILLGGSVPEFLHHFYAQRVVSYILLSFHFHASCRKTEISKPVCIYTL